MRTEVAFAFSEDDFVLETIGEVDGDDFDYSSVREISVTAEDVAAAKMKTVVLAADAEKRMLELHTLLGKLKTGTATRLEKDRIASLNGKLSAMKREIEETKTRESDLDMSMLRSVTRMKTFEVKKAMKEKDIRSVIRAVYSAESVDLAFIIDATGSMSSYIEGVKSNIRNIVSNIRKTNGNLRLRLAVVAYRDLGDGPIRHEVLDFGTDVHVFENFLSSLRATGGADAPEDMAGGLQKANELSWAHATRVVFLIADAPCHGSEFHTMGDSYPDGTPGVDIKNELRTLLSHKGSSGTNVETMSVYFGRITSDTDMMIRRFGDCGMDLEVVGLDEAHKMTAAVTKGVRKSIFKTITATGGLKSTSFGPVGLDPKSLLRGRHSGAGISLKSYSIDPRYPTHVDWKKMPAIPVKVYRNYQIKSINALKAPIDFGIIKFARGKTDEMKKSATMFMRRAELPFAEGEIRVAYHAQLSVEESSLKLEKSSMVFKSFKHHGKGVNDRIQYLKQMEVSNIAHFLAREYNKSSYRPAHCAMIHVLQVCVVEEDDEENESKGNRRFCAESPLPATEGMTDFTKYSNNTGHWNDECINESLLRFTDFTYEVTDHYLMVTDLQGVSNKDCIYLTDPVILCKDIMRFGHTNLGEKFMRKCIDSTRSLMKENGWN